MNVIYHQFFSPAKLVHQQEEISCCRYTVQEIDPYPDTQDTSQYIRHPHLTFCDSSQFNDYFPLLGFDIRQIRSAKNVLSSQQQQ